MDSARFLAIGALSIPYIKENWFDAIRHVFHDNVICIDPTPFYSLADFSSIYEYIYRLVIENDIKYVFFYFDWIFHKFEHEFFSVLKTAGIKVFVFYPDDEPEGWFRRNIQYDHYFDLIASHSLSGIERRRLSECSSRLLWLPWGYNHRQIKRLKKEHRYDVVFIGKNKVSDHVNSEYLEDGRERELALLEIAKRSKENGWRFRIFGFGWEKHPVLAEFAGGLISSAQFNTVHAQARIVFNPAWSNDNIPRFQTKLRHFEVPGAGAFQITNRNPELKELFEEDREICFYEEISDLIEKIEFYLKHDTARKRIAEDGWFRARNEHTLDQRARKLFRVVRQSWHAGVLKRSRPSLGNSSHKVRQFVVRNLEELKNLSLELEANPMMIKNADFVHILGGVPTLKSCEYAALPNLPRNGEGKILGMRSFLEFSQTGGNWLQPNPDNVSGLFLKETVRFAGLNPELLEVIRTKFISLESQEGIYLLTNFISRPAVTLELINCFLNGDVRKFTSFGIRTSRRLITHVVVDIPDSPDFSALLRNENLSMLIRVLTSSVSGYNRCVIYGAKGSLAKSVLDIFTRDFKDRLVGIVDNGMVGKTVAGCCVVGHEELLNLEPDLVVIAARVSGAAIYESLKLHKCRFIILPLHDLTHPIWDWLIS